MVNSTARIQLSDAVHNRNDYAWFLNDAGLLNAQNISINHKKRRVGLALTQYRKAISELLVHCQTATHRIDELFRFSEKVKNSTFVLMQVKTTGDAFQLFESLNNRGLSLSPVDLIKTKILEQVDIVHQQNPNNFTIDDVSASWNSWMERIPEPKDRERFFRQMYNAFQGCWNIQVRGHVLARTTNLIDIYDALIATNVTALVGYIGEAAHQFSEILDPSSNQNSNLGASLVRLTRCQSAASYGLVMYLLVRRSQLGLQDSDLERVFNNLSTFFVRRHLTGKPRTNELEMIFMDIISNIEQANLVGIQCADLIVNTLKAKSSNDSDFEERLRGLIYLENSSLVRFILASIEKNAAQYAVNFWKADFNKQWQVEHVFPQTSSLSNNWRRQLGRANQDEILHVLGNLTLTPHNQKLGTSDFKDKLEMIDAKNQFIGLANGLSINSEFKKSRDAFVNRPHVTPVWGKKQIDERTNRLVKEVISDFTFN